MRRFAVMVACLTLLVGVVLVVRDGGSGSPSGRADARRGAPTISGEGVEEAEEQRETVEARREAYEQALEKGVAGKTGPIRRRRAPGWSGERLFHPRANDWEPAAAADPNASYVYVLVTRYGGPGTCRTVEGRCLSPSIILEVSADGGRTWGPGRQLCVCPQAKGQFDPIVEVAAGTGDVYAVWMNDFHVVFSRSTDHGKTWTKPVRTYGRVAWNDKPVLAVSDDGRDVYVSWNGPSGGDLWIARSHDAGATWGQRKIVESGRYYFAMDADVLPDGTVVFAQSSLSYTGPNAAAEGLVRHHLVVSRDGGDTWQSVPIDAVELGVPCTSAGCYADFYDGHDAVSADAAGRLVYLYDGATAPGGNRRIWVRTSIDGGLTWSDRSTLSQPGRNATSPAVEVGPDGIVHAWYMQAPRAGRWNVWYRSSADGGATWSPPARISDAVSGAAYKTRAGFREVYGDYGELAIASTGETIAVWGEGFSWNGPGGVWFNRLR